MIDFNASSWTFQDGTTSELEQLSVLECFQVIHALKMLVHKHPHLLNPVYKGKLYRALTDRCRVLLDKLTDTESDRVVMKCVYG